MAGEAVQLRHVFIHELGQSDAGCVGGSVLHRRPLNWIRAQRWGRMTIHAPLISLVLRLVELRRARIRFVGLKRLRRTALWWAMKGAEVVWAVLPIVLDARNVTVERERPPSPAAKEIAIHYHPPIPPGQGCNGHGSTSEDCHADEPVTRNDSGGCCAGQRHPPSPRFEISQLALALCHELVDCRCGLHDEISLVLAPLQDITDIGLDTSAAVLERHQPAQKGVAQIVRVHLVTLGHASIGHVLDRRDVPDDAKGEA